MELSHRVRSAVRAATARPLLAIVAVTTIALGIGANTAIFGFVDGVLLRPLPFREPERLVAIWTSLPDNPTFPVSAAEYLDYRAEAKSFVELGAAGLRPVTVTGTGPAARLRAVATTRSLFDALGVSPSIGRAFTAEEERAGARAAILDHRLWVSRFGADPGVVDGGTLTVDGEVHDVVGVMPRTFSVPGMSADFYVPLALDRAAITNRSGHNLIALGRLGRAVPLDTARAELRGILTRWESEFAGVHPNDPVTHPLVLVPLEEQLLGSVRPMLWALSGAAGLVLLLAAANVANLLLARGQARRREFVLRAALGARRRDLVGQLVAESLVLATCGGLCGWGLAAGLTKLFKATAPADIPRVAEVALDWRALAFATGVTLVTGLLFGAVPALRALREDPREALAGGGRTGSDGLGPVRAMRSLIVVQVALAVVLLTGAGILIKSFVRLRAVEPGFETAGRLGFQVQLMAARYPEPSDVRTFQDRLRENIAAIPGVSGVAMARGLPLIGGIGTEGMRIEGRPAAADGRDPAVDFQVASDGYFALMGIPVVRGRAFLPSDREGAPPVVLINESAAQAYFPGEDPVGRRVRLLFAPQGWPAVTIVGVVGDVRHRALASEPRPELYLAVHQVPPGWATTILRSPSFVVRTDRPPSAIAEAVRSSVARLDPTVPLSNMTTLEDAVAGTLGGERFVTLLLGAFAALALTIGSVGIYGVMSFSVARRTREIGIRMALGARPAGVLRSVLQGSLSLTAAGVVIGLAVAALATRWLESLVFEVSVLDSQAFIASAVLLALVATLATLWPALRAARVDPVETLRAE